MQQGKLDKSNEKYHNSRSQLHHTTSIKQLQRLETLAPFPVISDILIVNTHLPPYQCCFRFSDDIQSNKQQH